MKILSVQFIEDLKSGMLRPILERIKFDSSLSMEIRQDYISIYYRGGRLLDISKGEKSYKPNYNPEFFNKTELEEPTELPNKISNVDDAYSWISAFPTIKNAMDLWLGLNKRYEREFQQVLVRENNFCKVAGSTDYYICDMEYEFKQEGEEGIKQRKVDLVAAHWPSTPASKKNNRNLSLAFIEMKYMDSSLVEGSGIKEHLNDIQVFLSEKQSLSSFKDELRIKYNQKMELGLIENNNKVIESFNDEIPEVILVLANHKPSNSVLKKVLDEIKSEEKKYSNFTLKFAVSNFMGFGLYQKNIYTLDDFMKKFEKQIYSK